MLLNSWMTVKYQGTLLVGAFRACDITGGCADTGTASVHLDLGGCVLGLVKDVWLLLLDLHGVSLASPATLPP